MPGVVVVHAGGKHAADEVTDVAGLAAWVEAALGIPKCGQKLILKGRVLTDDAEALKNGAKVMVVGDRVTDGAAAETAVAAAEDEVKGLETAARKQGKVSAAAAAACRAVVARLAALTLPPSAAALHERREDVKARCHTLAAAVEVDRVQESMHLEAKAAPTTFKFTPNAS
eukprot:TRINITY_DN4887_c0_g2_i1.p2 TRINITY_DN4887_c0_g2~~TRINITY_DN4887_c0_g2_i1.p2  ORF type:complete len:171 (+),score=55.43 TRINITY_DN4887_c0_g2_i1:158-670(+)